MYRSTKGASKARRDQINAEIRNLRDLLPISDADKARLSYLHIMSIACMYTRKCVFFSQDSPAAAQYDIGSVMALADLSELVHTLPGFLMLLTNEGKLLYLSDNITEHLGHSMVDLVAQSDSVYDLLDPSDHFVMRSNLVSVTTPDTERLFRCRFNTSKFARRQGSGNKTILVRARSLLLPYLTASYWTTNSVWVCFCSPLELHTSNTASSRNPLPTPPAEQAFQLTSFQSQHSHDMRIQAIQECVSVYLGYDVDTLCSRSWYSLLHPRDISHASNQHCTLLREGRERQVEMVVQVEAADHSWVWLYMVLQLQTAEHPITCQNYVISESEAWSVRQQLDSEQNQLALLYQEGLVQQFSSLSSPDQVFTPSSSGLSAQSFDFSFTISGHSSSEELPSSTPQSNLSLGSCPSFPVNENISQPHESQQTWLPESRNHSTGTVHPSLDEIPNMADIQPASQAPTHLTSISSSKPQSIGEFLCTPPYTPRGSCFRFGEEFFKPDTVISSSSQMTQANQPTCLSTGIGLALSAQRCHIPLFEKLPLSPDTPANEDNEDCVLMTLPEITGPLYVDVPLAVNQGPPDCLLTPEASPTEHNCLGFFPQHAEKEKLEISILAQYLSSVAEGFWKDRPLTTRPSSPAHLQELLSTQNSVPLSCEFPPTMDCEELYSSLVQDHMSLEKLAVPLPQPSPSPLHCSLEHAPPAPQEEALVGVQNLCSIQSTHCNRVRILESSMPDDEALAETAMDEAMSPPVTSSSLPASLGSTPGPALNPLSPGLPCAQSLLEELVSTEPVFEAAASMNPALRQQSELYQLPFQESPQHFYQDGTGDHMF